MIQRASEFMGRYILFFLPQSTPGTMEHPWDYVAHFIVSFAGVGIIYLALFFPLKTLGLQPKITLLVSAGIMLAIGIIKEVNDKNLGKQDMAGDILGDILGIILAALLIFIAMKVLN